MTMESFCKDDVTSSNNIPWLYDLDTCGDDGDDVTTTLTVKTDKIVGDDVIKFRAEDSLFSVPLDPPFRQPIDRVLSAKMSRDESFIKSFSESLSNSVVEDAYDGDLSAGDAAAVSKLMRLYVRNLAVLGVATMLSQAPFFGVRSLQSSLGGGGGGRWALVVYHAAVTLAAPLLRSAAVSSRCRPKTAVVLSVVAGLPFAVVDSVVQCHEYIELRSAH